jgi:cytochrome bd ubiquinol oxidase subunit I
VYELMRTEQAVTDAGGLWLGFGLLAAVYLSLLAAVVWLLRRLERSSPELEAEPAAGVGA